MTDQTAQSSQCKNCGLLTHTPPLCALCRDNYPALVDDLAQGSSVSNQQVAWRWRVYGIWHYATYQGFPMGGDPEPLYAAPPAEGAPASDGARNAHSSLHKMIGEIYAGLDEEDCAWVDREWAKFRSRSPAGRTSQDFDTLASCYDAVVEERNKLRARLQSQSGTGSVCCYCDAPLCCDTCGREQPDDSTQPGSVTVDMSAELMDAAATIKRLSEALRESITDNVWNAYNIGIVRDGKWMDGCRSEAEWITRRLGLDDGCWHDEEMVKSRLPEIIEKELSEILSRDGQ